MAICFLLNVCSLTRIMNQLSYETALRALSARRDSVMAPAPKSPPLPPPEPLSPAMAAWWNATRARHSDLAAANARISDALVEAEAERARNSNEAPTNYIPIKVAIAHAPHVHREHARRLCASGEIEAKQNGKGGRWRLSHASFLRAVRENLG
jgi:hypothetical protein